MFPAGVIEINRDLGCRTDGDKVVSFNGHLPVFTHARDDLASFRLFTSQLIVEGGATQGQICRAFRVPLVAIKRATKLFRERGAAGFFVPPPRREGTRLDNEKLAQARGGNERKKNRRTARIEEDHIPGHPTFQHCYPVIGKRYDWKSLNMRGKIRAGLDWQNQEAYEANSSIA